ncbi:MAG: YlxM family DNA-binding protein [Clostridium sp.]|nr:YlxM family DNA-binding protein [Clostridium sp.]
MEKIFRQALLYDFYGELLTPRQRKVYEDVIHHDLSLGEIADEEGISRQGVHDLAKRCDHILQGYEDKLHLVRKFTETQEKIQKIIALTEAEGGGLSERMASIRKLSMELLETGP